MPGFVTTRHVAKMFVLCDAHGKNVDVAQNGALDAGEFLPSILLNAEVFDRCKSLRARHPGITG